MNTVKVKKSELLKTLLANREKHRKKFDDANAGFQKKLLAKLEKLIRTARRGDYIKDSIGLSRPVSYLEQYDTALSMLRMSVDDVIELDREDFAKYVLDDWAWKEHFLANSSLYTKKIRK